LAKPRRRPKIAVNGGSMHIELGTALIVTALASSIVLVLNRGDRIFPVVALLASGLAALIHFDIISLSSGKFRIDVILPALLTVAGGVCWARSSTKSTNTASTLVLVVGILQLFAALRILG
jgi:hypothetical protein